MHGIVPERVRAVQIACVQVVALYGSELWWDPRETGRRDDLQLLLNRQARSTLGALPTTLLGARSHLSTGRVEVYDAELLAFGLALRESVKMKDTLQTTGVMKVAVFRDF
jgi:hypothetical protein